jgi:hypothetical protein
MLERFLVIAVCVLYLVLIIATVISIRDCSRTGEFRPGFGIYSSLEHRYVCPDGSDRWL